MICWATDLSRVSRKSDHSSSPHLTPFLLCPLQIRLPLNKARRPPASTWILNVRRITWSSMCVTIYPPCKESLSSTCHTRQTHHHGLLLVFIRNKRRSTDPHEGGWVVDHFPSSVFTFKLQLRPSCLPVNSTHCPVLTINQSEKIKIELISFPDQMSLQI